MEPRPVKIYSSEDSPRLLYIAGLILGDILGLSWEIITDKRKLGKHNVINYSKENVSGSFKIYPDSLLFERGINSREINVNDWKGLPVFFMAPPDSDLPFDIFAASFYLVTRYEEYQVHEPDKYGRFRASESLAFKNGFLEVPVVDIWAREFALELVRKFHNIAFRRNDFKSVVTFDADQPFAYRAKGLMRSIGGLFRDIRNNQGNAGDRYKSVTGGEKDPFDVFDYIFETLERHNQDVRFFFPVGNHSDYDKNPSWKNNEYRDLIHRTAEKFNSGLHPSFYVDGNLSLLETEVSRLRTILQDEITTSRFHYIRLSIPESYNDLLKAGIMEDYSMGYPDETGFRAGIARPYNFYNVADDQQTSLRIIPFQVMDVTLYIYKKLDPDASRELILKLIDETRKVGGLFVSIWHNTSLLDNSEWQGWRELFEFMLKKQSP
jgi:hypothetical protein